ncbi:S-adenosyl-L-methionine-dependent methyltransferase [Xylariales sp. PMI_506]|nr:S-adenosyl-L-methionine-dependent methyltransferase [Xylariales sp. PMI_506]
MAPPTNFSSIAPGIDTPDGYFIPHAYNPDPYPDPIHIPTGSSVIDTDSVVGDFGRTYHGYKEGKYLLPNDAAEQDRLDFQYAGVSVLLAGRLFFAPIVNPKYAIDIATGTGIWAIEFAEMFPNCQVIGTDLSSIQPTNPPSNVTFLKDDAESDWVFPYKFDYVHLRIIFTCFNDHKRMMQEAFKSMHSGGWMEYQDPDASCVGCVDNETPDYFAFQRVISAARIGAKLLVGRDIALTRKYKGWMEEVGFVNVHEHKVRIPLSPWPTDPREKLGGSYMQRNYLDGALMALWKMVRASGMSEVETKCLFTDAKAELLDTSKRLYTVLYVVYGQKP